MHELSLAHAITEAIIEKVGRKPLSVIRLDVGALSGVSADSLTFCLGEVARAEELGQPAIEVRTIPPTLRCTCGREYAVKEVTDPCPACGGFDRQIIAGTEMTVTSVDLVEETPES